jgi:translation initiation factor IF-2
LSIRVQDLSKELKISSAALKKHLHDLGIEVKSHLSQIEDDTANRIRGMFNDQISAARKLDQDRKAFQEHKKAPVPEQPKPVIDEPVEAQVTETQAVSKAEEIEQPAKEKESKKPEIVPTVTLRPNENVATEQQKRMHEKAPIIDGRTRPTGDRPVQGSRQPDRQYQQGGQRQDGQQQYNRPPQQGQRPGGDRYQQQGGRSSDRPQQYNRSGDAPRSGGYDRDRRPQGDSAGRPPYHNDRNQGAPGRDAGQGKYDARPTFRPKPSFTPASKTDSTEGKSVRIGTEVPITRKFGKNKAGVEEFGEKSKHLKAKINSTKKGKKPTHALPTEIEEAEIAKNIRATMAKSHKKKKYTREPQSQVVMSETGEIIIREFTSVSELAKIMNKQPTEIIGKLFQMGQLANINQRLDRDTLELICNEFEFHAQFEDEYGVDLIEKETEKYTDAEDIIRPPVVTIMGHVDHGKTSILDYIRESNVVAGESGGITQHIGAYQITYHNHKITFLDTPGHEAFTAMRARGANATDIAIIVVAANDGVMPQTKEAIDHAKAAGVSMIIAINKIDLPDANVDKCIAQLLENGVYLEQYGGEVPWAKCSAVSGKGIPDLLELILLTSEMKELTAKQDVPASGVVIEAEKDPHMGAVVTILLQEGTLSKGDVVCCGATYGRVRKLENERFQEIKILYPSDIARIYGLNDVPKAGDILNQVANDKIARQISSERLQIRLEREKYHNKTSLQNLFIRIKENQMSELKIIVKGDTDGSVEALCDSFQKLSTAEVAVNIIHKSVGGIIEADVNLANASDAIIIGFHVRANAMAKKLAEDEGVEIKTYQIIYNAIEDVRLAMVGLLKPTFQEKFLGSATVKQVFKIKKVGTIAGCFVKEGIMQRNAQIRVYRDDVLIHDGKMSSLKHYANEASEVKAGSDCGISIENFTDLKENDTIEAYIMEEMEKKL